MGDDSPLHDDSLPGIEPLCFDAVQQIDDETFADFADGFKITPKISARALWKVPIIIHTAYPACQEDASGPRKGLSGSQRHVNIYLALLFEMITS